MARKPKSTKKTNKFSLKKLVALLIVAALLVVGEHFYIKLGINGVDVTKTTTLETIIESVKNTEFFKSLLLGKEDTENTEDVLLENNSNTDNDRNDEILNDTVSENQNNVPTKYDDSSLKVYFFDVGQADSILLLTDGKAMLVDTGNAGDATTKNTLTKGNINLTYELKKLGVERIDILVATHPHEDHMGSMHKIIEAFKIGDLYANAMDEEIDKRYYERFYETMVEYDVHLISPTTLTEEQIKAQIKEFNSSITDSEEKLEYNAEDYIRVGDVINFGDAKITMIAPNSAEYSDTNDYSLVFMVEFEAVKLLLTGDAGKESEEEMLKFAKETGFDLDCDVLKVGHHGSRTANTEEFIAAVKPEHSVIMVEEGNSYGLPDEDVIECLQKYDSKIYYTMNEGDITLLIDDGKYEFDFSYKHEEKQ